MNYSKFRKYDISNGVGVRCSLFVSGCTHHCKGCFNKETWDFDYGEHFTTDVKNMIINHLKQPQVDGISILGGEPFDNAYGLIPLLSEIALTIPDKDVWIYSGYTYEQLTKRHDTMRLLSLCDVLVDGKFVEELKDITLKFRGSTNQRIINIHDSLFHGEIVEVEL